MADKALEQNLKEKLGENKEIYSASHPDKVQVHLRTLREAAKERLYLRASAVL
ncbi:MAG: hypothetical protein HC862_07275 [Scytonema sp. RU_4_4]|nr:hypothetical protein [Scytonema sp. RU_4_4]